MRITNDRHTHSFTNKLHKYSLNIHIHVYSPVNDLLILWLQCRQMSKIVRKKKKFINILIRYPNTLTLVMPERNTTITNTAAASLYSPFSHILKHLQHFTPFVRPFACQHLFYYPFCCCCDSFFVMNYTRCTEATLTSWLSIVFHPYSGTSFWLLIFFHINWLANAQNWIRFDHRTVYMFITKYTKFTSQYCLVRWRWTNQQHEQRLTQFIAMLAVVSVDDICVYVCVRTNKIAFSTNKGSD